MNTALALQVDEQRDITQHEIVALRTPFNLADAHTHQRQSPSQQDIVAQLPRLWYESETLMQCELEQRFMQRFFELQRQPTALKTGRTLLVYAASIAMSIAATYCMQRRLTVSLLEPCFDNLRDLLKNLAVPLLPLREEIFHDADTIYDKLKETITGDAICIVDPNNPTGFTLLQHGRRGFAELLRFCRDTNKLLLLDLSFASFAFLRPDLGRFDLYEMLEDSEVSYMAMEDTGKVWPVQDAKCALITVSRDLYREIYDIHTSVLLNVSPFILNMLTHYLANSAMDSFASVRDVLNDNRQYAIQQLEASLLEYQEPAAPVSVAWLRIRKPSVSATNLQRAAYASQVYVLPGTYFYWNRPTLGDRFVRLALARNSETFREAIGRLRQVVDALDR